ncbi:MAG: hypothetical protein EOO39_20225, partial [Cytophagaceae bacterium]
MNEGGGVAANQSISIVYGPMTTINTGSIGAVQVGVRSTTSDFRNRTTSSSWTATTAGAANTDRCVWNSTVGPASGLTFTYTPGPTTTPPNCATAYVPATGATNISLTPTLSWTAATGSPTSYDVYFGTNSSPAFIGNQTALTYAPTGLALNTRYYWKIVAKNANGDAVSCTTQSFTTINTPDYVNLQFPATASFPAGGSVAVFGQVYEAGVTEAAGAGAGIEAWVGISPIGSNTNPSTWATFVPATFNVQSGNNDEYTATIGSTLVAGTYYYATRFRINNGPYVYGGYPNNEWNGTTSNSGVLTVSANPTQCPTLTSPANAAVNVPRGSITLSWTAPTTGPAPTSYDVYGGTTSGSLTLLGNQTGTTRSVTLSTYSTTYYWRVIAKSTIGGSASGCAEFSFTTVADPFAPYCSDVTYSDQVEPITLVNFAGINNASSDVLDGTPAIENFTTVTGNVTTQSIYPIIVKGNTGGDYQNTVRVWIDWNKNGTFEQGERYSPGNLSNTTGIDNVQVTTNISVPATALAGQTRMRIKKLYTGDAGAPNNACTGGQFGQTEDYTINVTICTPVTWYADTDADGFGNPAVTVSACNQPANYVANNTDCNDADPTKHATFPFYVDTDNDGVGAGSLVSVCAVNSTTPPIGYSLSGTDCNNNNAAISAQFPFYADLDGDGVGAGSLVNVCAANATTPPAGYSVSGTDC